MATSTDRTETVETRLIACSSWVQQTFRVLQDGCLTSTQEGRWRDSANGIGRSFYVRAAKGPYCRLDPKKEYIGIGFCNAIRDQVRGAGILRANRSDMAWAFVKRSDDLRSIMRLIRQAAKAGSGSSKGSL